ncbi:anti-sigma factor family protein [Neoroseomonas lacus]|uniref:Regulator n=1 Tax=Neoroseomonas lacus TaxID=287609 RepID=A0A917L509_9PROT|nr:anti-sigma factor [Neoroseomonas lacus]GGJ42724.1 regulator [Neoroseomonas lacus]
MSPIIPDEEMLHAYVDGRLDAEARRRVEAFLARDLNWAEKVAGWKRDAERLRAAATGWALMPPNPRLDPTGLRRAGRKRRQRRLATAAVLLLVAGLGGGAGWTARERMFAAAHPPMADAVSAYRVFATAGANAVEVSASGVEGMQAWLAQHLDRGGARLPDLTTYGVRLLGGRLLATDEGPAAMVFFEDEDGRRIAFFMRPGPPFATETIEERRDGGLLARYWHRNGYRFAVVAPADDARAAEIARVLRVGG